MFKHSRKKRLKWQFVYVYTLTAIVQAFTVNATEWRIAMLQVLFAQMFKHL